MPSIKDLKNSQDTTVIDLTKPPVESNNTNNVVKQTGGGKTVVNMNGMFNSNINNGRHSVVEPKVKGQVRAAKSINNTSDSISIDMTGNSNGRRVAADLSSLPSKTPEEEAYAKEHFIDNPIDTIIGENKNSILDKYLVHKEQELINAYEQVKYNKELKELEDEAAITGDDSAVIDFINKKSDNNQIDQKSSKVIINDDDILSSLSSIEEKEEEEVNNNFVNESEDMEEGQDYLVHADDDDDVVANDLFEAIENKEVEPDEEVYDDSELDDDQLYPEDISLGDELAGKYDEPEGIQEEVKEPVIEEKKVVVENPNIDLEVTEVSNSSNDIIDNIDVSLEEEDAPEPVDDTENIIKKLQALATEKLKPVSKRLDISSFTVVKKPISNTSQFNINPVKAAKWVLMNQGATVIMREFTGAELERLREFTQDGNSVSSLTKRYRLIYDHIDSPKPAKFETWLKSTPFSDEDNYFFAVYIASFKGANYLPRDCSDQTSCKETWLTDDINIMDMVKFDSEEAKNKFTKIYQEEDSSVTKAGLYISEIVPLSNTVAVAFREPSIYTRIELSSLDQEFREKYQAILEFIPYIDSLYLINQEEGTLTPVGYKLFTDNNIRTTKSKIQQFAKVLSTLSIDEFGTIRPYVNSIAERTSGISYIFPECTCPKCGSKVNETSTTAEELLFTRYQLGALVNTSLN